MVAVVVVVVVAVVVLVAGNVRSSPVSIPAMHPRRGAPLILVCAAAAAACGGSAPAWRPQPPFPIATPSGGSPADDGRDASPMPDTSGPPETLSRAVAEAASRPVAARPAPAPEPELDRAPIPNVGCAGVWPPAPKPRRYEASCCYPAHGPIHAAVRARHGAFRDCYEKALTRASPGLAGRVTARLSLSLDGSVAAACDAGTTLADAEAARCILDAFRGVRFPSQIDDGFCPPITSIVYPIEFRPGDG